MKLRRSSSYKSKGRSRKGEPTFHDLIITDFAKDIDFDDATTNVQVSSSQICLIGFSGSWPESVGFDTARAHIISYPAPEAGVRQNSLLVFDLILRYCSVSRTISIRRL